MNREKIATALESLEAYRESHLVPAYFLNALANLRSALNDTPAQTNPTNEHREQARKEPPERVWITRDDAYPWETPETGGDEYVRAASLSSRDAEIREVLEGLATYRNPLCWCPPNTEAEPHTEACRATAVLYAKLQPGKEGEGDVD